MVVQHANKLAAEGFDVRIVTAICETKFALHSSVDVEHISSKSTFRTLLYAFVNRLNADFVVADIILLAVFLFIRNHGRIVYFAQDYDEYYYKSRLMRLMVRGGYVFGLGVLRIPVLAVSNYLAGKLRRFAATVQVVENFIELDTFYPDPDESVLLNRKQGKAVVVLCRDDWRKGFDIVENVINGLSAEVRNALEVWTVGNVPDKPFAVFKQQNLGYLEPAALRKALSCADFFFYPSRHEGFGLMVLEAMACGCPVVCSDGVPDEVHQGAALVAPVNDPDGFRQLILALLSDNTLANKIAHKGIEVARGFKDRTGRKSFSEALNLFT